MTRRGTCSNYAGCLLAYRNETIPVSEGEFVCPECKQPLTPVGDAPVAKKLAPVTLIAGGLVILAVLGVVVSMLFSTRSRIQRTAETPAPTASATPVAAPFSEPAAEPTAPRAEPVLGTTTQIPDSEPVEAPKAQKPDLDLGKDENRQVKAEVLRRIDLMPTISAENKDKLYVSVERAKQMGRIIIIPFGKGKTTISASDTEALRTELQSADLKQLMDDPTAVFVVLGFADTKGDEKMNLRISQERADAVMKTLREKCGIINVMHAVAMGGSNLFDTAGTEKNRVAEVWAVLP